MGGGEAGFRTEQRHPPGAMVLGEQGQPLPTPCLGGKERGVGNEQPNLSLPSCDVLLEAAIGECWNWGHILTRSTPSMESRVDLGQVLAWWPTSALFPPTTRQIPKDHHRCMDLE